MNITQIWSYYPRNTVLEQKIKKCRKENRYWSYSRIARFVKCARSTPRYVLDSKARAKKYNLRYPKVNIN